MSDRHEERERRSTFLQLKNDMKVAAVAAVMIGRNERFTCRVAINAGIELLLAGVELMKMHGITKAQVLEFTERLFDHPGDIEEMTKGGRNEPLLRMAMKIINGPIIRHTGGALVVEGEAKNEHKDDVFVPPAQRRLNTELN